MHHFTYQREKARQISFPLGGIGTGCIGLAGNGQLIDAEIFGRPNKGSHMAFTHFAVRADDGSRVIDARIANGDIAPPFTGAYNRPNFNSYGFGSDRSTLAGLPHFQDCTFTGEFPIAALDFLDAHFPGTLRLTAFNPFIPLNDRDSTIPGAFFIAELTNTTKQPLNYTVALTANNLYTRKGGLHSGFDDGSLHGIHLKSGEYSPEDVKYGDLSIATDCKAFSRQLYWYRGNWFDNLATFWKDFTQVGPLKERDYKTGMKVYDANYAADDLATLAAHISIAPGETRSIRFVYTWNTPNCVNYWNPESKDCGCADGCCGSGPSDPPKTWKNYYATLFADSAASARYAVKEFGRLYQDTLLFHDTLFSSTLPAEAIDAVSANLAIIKSPTCLRLEDGSLYGFEGCHCDGGCCEGSCTHVWNYTYAIPFLFPKLERSMRTLEYSYSMTESGGMGFRLMLPIGRAPTQFRPCVDGQFGTVMRVLREYKISGDRAWLNQIWPEVKRSIEYAWSTENYDKWDLDKDGIMEGRQHHTLDMELFGPNAWLSGLYLGALKAGAALAEIMGEAETAREYTQIYESGRKQLNDTLFNGEYFYQKVDIEDRSVLDPYREGGKSLQNQDIYTAYWNEEQQELMYQIADGCGIDQVLAQWHANLIGLGDIFDPEKTRSALRSIYKYNFIKNMREHFNPCRLYCINDEGGLVICQWPEGRKKPVIPAPYSEETMHGFEYQAAIHMIQEGMVEEGMTCIRALRDRYDGERRNPWNEFECGSNYARSMAAYALLPAFSGFSYDVPKGEIGFAPIGAPESFSCIWSLDSGWGKVEFSRSQVKLIVLQGSLTLSTLSLKKQGTAVSVEIDGADAAFVSNGDALAFAAAHTVKTCVTVAYQGN